jgi:hypothetical protein
VTRAQQPEDAIAQEPGRQQRPLPRTVAGLEAMYTAAFSGLIKDIQRSVVPALRVRIPAIPASAFKLPRIQPSVVPTVQKDITRQVTAALEAVLRV